MKMLSFKSGKGGALAAVDTDSRRLLFSYEAEKDSFPKNTSATVDTFIDGAVWFDDLPDVICLSGMSKAGREFASSIGAGYFGIGPEAQALGRKTFFGRNVLTYSSTHERAHIWSAYGLSPFPQGMPCYVLCWDDVFGDFYRIDADLTLHHLGRVMDDPCRRFALAYAFADPARAGSADAARDRVPDSVPGPMPDPTPDSVRGGDFGRMAGAVAFGDPSRAGPQARDLIDHLLSGADPALPAASPLRGIGTGDQGFRDFAAGLSDAIFARFHDFARRHLTEGHPLLVTGEGALNSRWLTRWEGSGLFAGIFAAPPAGDAGCAIGTAVDAMRHFTGAAKLDWSVYSGQPFEDDARTIADLAGEEVDLGAVAARLEAGQVIGWVRGSCELGPRALGNRSILAAPFDPAMRERLNRIKGRPGWCPVAPVCLEEDAAAHFDGVFPSPYMLHLHRVTDARLGAVTHVDGTARLQTVSRDQNPMLHDLLAAFRQRTGVGVLCNTSLNFPGAGFINRASDLHHFARIAGLDGFLAGIRFHPL